MRNRRLSRQGFTLVELSIVLVIIGLLIGGILVGQSLIESAKFKRLQNTLVQVEVFSSLYKTRFRQLPGDDLYAQQKFGASACGGACNGNGDGIIHGLSGYNSQESARFWHHLKLSGLLEGSGLDIVVPATLPAYDGNVYLAEKHIPEFKDIEKTLSIIGFGNPKLMSASYDSCNQALIIGKATVSNPAAPTAMINVNATTALNSKYAKYLDNKIDDYVPNTGKIMATSVNVSSCLGAGNATYRTTNVNGYTPANQECNILWCMDK